MAQKMHNYTIVFGSKDYNLTTDKHHSEYNSVEDWLKAHKATIDRVFDTAHLGVQIINVYLNHNRGGQRLK